MTDSQERLLKLIDDAFRGVSLGDGVSLHQTAVIDMCGSLAKQLEARALDEKENWKRLVDDPELKTVCSVGGLSFYDAEGLRFHLPAYLTIAVTALERRETSDIMQSLIFQLTHFTKHQVKRFSILNENQRRCVREVLEFIRDEFEPDDEFTRIKIDRAICDYWNSRINGQV
jgi:hypothetical protein